MTGPQVRFAVALADTLSISFQRYPCPAPGVLHELPRSWGALPVVQSGRRALTVPLPDGEGAWVGLLRPLDAPAWAVRVRAHLQPGGPTDAVAGHPSTGGAADLAVLPLPPRRALEGIARPAGGWWPLTRRAPGPEVPGCTRLEVWAQRDDAEPEQPWTVDLVDPAAFAAQTGAEVAQLSPDAPYGGWRLP